MRKERTEEQKQRNREAALRRYHKNKEEINKKKRNKYKTDPAYAEQAKIRGAKKYYNRQYYYINQSKEWKHKNPHKVREYVARHTRNRKASCPDWLTSEQRKACQDVYLEAERLTAETGIPHHVDHIYPIRGKLVCGLHVPWNLRAIPAPENFAKRNKMPEDFYGISSLEVSENKFPSTY